MNNTLLLCPFCGKEPITFPPTLTRRQLGTDPSKVHGQFYSEIRCSCGAAMQGPNHDMDCKQVIETWNRRRYPAPVAVSERVDEDAPDPGSTIKDCLQVAPVVLQRPWSRDGEATTWPVDLRPAATPPAEGEPAPPAEGEAAELVEWLAMLRDRSAGLASNCYNNNLSRIIALLQQRYLPPTPPADGEVAELVELLKLDAKSARNTGALIAAATLTRTAELLKQRHPTPIEVEKRSPGPEDCNAKGQCWQEEPGSATEPPGWYLTHYRFIIQYGRGRWLPFHSLPTTGDNT